MSEQIMLTEGNADIMCFSETWLKLSSIPDHLLHRPPFFPFPEIVFYGMEAASSYTLLRTYEQYAELILRIATLNELLWKSLLLQTNLLFFPVIDLLIIR